MQPVETPIDVSALEVAPSELEALAIFPLDSVVLLPQTLLPLHIFEPRYREMTQAALERGAPIAIAAPEPGAFDDRWRPRVLPVAGVGKIVRHQQLDDGRWNILLFGLERIRIEQELDVTTPYRQVRATIEDSTVHSQSDLETGLASVRSLALAIQSLEPKVAGEIARMLDDRDGPSRVADRLASLFFPDAGGRQALLEELRVERRMSVVVERMTTYFAQLSNAKAGDRTASN